MTVIDLAIIAGVAAAIRLFTRNREQLQMLGLTRPFVMLAAGMMVVAGFYLVDLLIMFVWPLFAGSEASMRAMTTLHLEGGWIPILMGVLLIAGAAAIIINRLSGLVGELSASRDEVSSKEQRAITIADATFEGILVLEDDAIVDSNSHIADMMGYQPGELSGKTLEELLAPESRELRHQTTDEPADVLQGIGLRKSGERFPIELRRRWIDSPSDAPGRWVVAMRDISDHASAQAALERGQERLRTLTHRILDARESERTHIARTLHEQVGQALIAAKLQLGTASGGVEPSLSILDEAASNIREISLELRPSMLDDIGIVSAVRWLATEWSEQTGMTVTCTADVPTEPEPSIAIVCFRIAQEAVKNAALHSAAQSVAVELLAEGGTLQLTVTDDGSGFDVDGVWQTEDRGVGLIAAREQADRVGGTLSVDSGAQGTTVTARFST